MVHLTPGAVYKPRFGTSRGPCLAPVVLSFKLVEHRGEDWHELTHQIKRAVNSKGKCNNCGHLMTAEMLTKFFS